MRKYEGVKLIETDAIFMDEEPTAICYFCKEEVKAETECSWIYDAHDTDEEEFVCKKCTKIYVEIHDRAKKQCALCNAEIKDEKEFCHDCEQKIQRTFIEIEDEEVKDVQDQVVRLDWDTLADDLRANKIKTLTKSVLKEYLLYY